MLPIGEVLVQIGQPGAEILSSLRLVLLSLFPQYLRGRLSFGVYFFTEEEHFYRYIDMRLKIGLSNGLACPENFKCPSPFYKKLYLLAVLYFAGFSRLSSQVFLTSFLKVAEVTFLFTPLVYMYAYYPTLNH